ncbi:hypothetical protein [Bradyrhizobium sp.]|uniref:hypothetical protein n=1 Tax=Bradyrhizobium sp. TaxID=376 RepID=UPI0025BEE7AC|nr:hypothetical protein [Bradyrhizobium sp.]
MDADRERGRSPSTSMIRHPGIIALAVAVFGIGAIVVVDYGPWSRAKIQTAELAMYRTTGEAARAAGAAVTPTTPKSPIEPEQAGPNISRRVNPVIP